MSAQNYNSIVHWGDYFKLHNLTPEDSEFAEHACLVRPEINEKVYLWKGDITTLQVDAIVNSTSPTLQGTNEVSKAIHLGAGDGLREECRQLRECKVGDAVITRGHNLQAKHVIHTVPSSWGVELRNCYKNCFRRMLELSAKSIAFPCIGTGRTRYDTEEAAHIALQTVRDFLSSNYEKVEQVILCVFSHKDLKIYERLVQRYFPVIDPNDKEDKNFKSIEVITDSTACYEYSNGWFESDWSADELPAVLWPSSEWGANNSSTNEWFVVEDWLTSGSATDDDLENDELENSEPAHNLRASSLSALNVC